MRVGEHTHFSILPNLFSSQNMASNNAYEHILGRYHRVNSAGTTTYTSEHLDTYFWNERLPILVSI